MTTRMVRRTMTPVPTEMLSLRDMMGRLMESAFVAPDRWYGGEEFGRLPAVDIAEDQDNYVINAELPGWKPQDIDITCEGDTIVLRGQMEEESEQSDGNTRWHRREMSRNSFERHITLPTSVQTDKAVADFENGILTLKLPKSEESKPKQIKVTQKAGNGGKRQ